MHGARRVTVCGTRLITVSALYTNVESPRYMPDANVIVYVNYNLKINLGKKGRGLYRKAGGTRKLPAGEKWSSLAGGERAGGHAPSG